ncbi:IS3 family transposase [Corynebacterium sp. LaCa97]|uniref:IS3 family transposase n=1 Tax=Corynebacterium sp. LaCa97 TaxID=3391431 RepID=UPI003988DEB7
MQQEKANYSIKRMARLLKVSRSGYYKWTHIQQQRLTGKDDRASFYDDVDRKIHQIWKDSDEVYGAPRITAELGERYQISVNRKTVAKRMRLMGIEGCQMRVFGTGVLGTRYCRVPGSWYRAEGCVGPDR